MTVVDRAAPSIIAINLVDPDTETITYQSNNRKPSNVPFREGWLVPSAAMDAVAKSMITEIIQLYYVLFYQTT